MEGIDCFGFVFYNDFDSANLAKVDLIPPSESVITKQSSNTKSVIPEVPDAEFNIWTKPDCCGTEFENGNRTWFHFGLKAPQPSLLVKFNIVNLNRQGKMYSQGMAPVYRIVPGKPQWERIRERPVYSLKDDIFTLSFKFRTPENLESVMYFAFTYPFSYVDLQKLLANVDRKHLSAKPTCEDDIYYVRECICTSLEGRNVDLLTITSYHGITTEREDRLKNLFKNKNCLRPHKFTNKKVIFVSARVHPGETPSSFVFNGFLQLLLNRDDLTAICLRRMYVFKLIPFLNPDGVARGHYRTDTRGVNLNRVYRNPSFKEHPSVYAARALIRYYHFGAEKEDNADQCDNCCNKLLVDNIHTAVEQNNQTDISHKVSHMSLEECDKSLSTRWCSKCKNNILKLEGTMPGISSIIPTFNLSNSLGRDYCRNCGCKIDYEEHEEEVKIQEVGSHGDINSNESGLFMYIDMHGHASKKGIFMYGNHFDDLDRSVECMLLPKLMSLNNHNFHFNSCNFTERNMYLRDKKDGMSRAGSGRVAVLSFTGLVRSYTLECNYNTGRIINVLPPTIRENSGKMHTLPVPPKYSPPIFEEVGKCLGASILDLTAQNPVSRLPNSEFHSLHGLRDWLRINSVNEYGEIKPKLKVKEKVPGSLHSQGKSTRGTLLKSRTSLTKPSTKKTRNPKCRPNLHVDRKENLNFPTSLSAAQTQQPSCSNIVSTKSVSRMNKCFGLKNKSRKEITLKTKPAIDKSKSTLARNKGKLNVTPKKVRLDFSTKMQSRIENVEKPNDSSDIVQLREICFIKSNEGKTLIAKYTNNDGDVSDDNLVVSWDSTAANPQIYTQKSRGKTVPLVPTRCNSEPGSSKQGVFRVHNFVKNCFSKNKGKKHTLRRLASATDSLAKADKTKKKKKLKAK